MRYFITGGTGSLGQALLERLHKEHEITVYSRDEVKQSELRAKYDVNFMLGDVRDYDRLLLVMRKQDVVIHAAAYKQVPSAEANVTEAIATNVIGSQNVARAAVFSNVRHVVGVSTDKACQPVNAYGETKALMEKLFQQAASWSDTQFNCVRYGNVLGSRGSVVPLFRRQIEAGKPVTVTNGAMTRFWMTLSEAVQLVMYGCLSAKVPYQSVENGAILVPECPAAPMSTLVDAVYRVYAPNVEPTFEVTGTRPGEKLHEQLIHANESLHTVDPTDGCPYYQIMPATYGKHRERLLAYNSLDAYTMSASELADKIRESVDA